MIVRTPHRLAALVGPAAVAVLVLSGCGGGTGDAATLPTVTLNANETSYQTLPPQTTTTTISGAEAAVGAEQEYTVQSGDYGLKVANQFGVSVDDLEAINGWADASKEFPFPGTVIKIPAGGTIAQPSVATATEADTGAGTASTPDVVGETIPEVGSGCEPGSYTIEEGDTSRQRVADKFDVTVEAMDAANSGTSGYSAFYPGLKIVIPAKADC